MEGKLIEILETFGYPIFQQGCMGADEVYPDSFFTFINIDTPDGSFYDNEPTTAIWSFYLCFYSNDPLLVSSKLKEATQKLKQNGWIIGSRNGKNAPSDVNTHTGKITTVYFIERED